MNLSQLEQCLSRLNEADRLRAADLMRSIRSRLFRGQSATPGQARYVQSLIDRANALPAATIQIKGLEVVPRMLKHAAEHLRYPSILVRVDNRDLRLTIAGARARVPGSINVVEHPEFEDEIWHGRIYDDGRFETSSRTNESQRTAILLALRHLAKNPQQAAADYGHLTGHCCFCGRSLDDERSTRVGYGPICAEHYNLPWG